MSEPEVGRAIVSPRLAAAATDARSEALQLVQAATGSTIKNRAIANLTAAAAGLGVLIAMIAVLTFVHRRREGSSDHTARQQRAEPGTE